MEISRAQLNRLLDAEGVERDAGGVQQCHEVLGRALKGRVA